MAKRKVSVDGSLRSIRKRLGLSQQELGDLLGAARNTIRSWETGSESKFVLLLSKGLRLYSVFPHIKIDFTGPCLAAARGRLRLHQDEFADRLGVSRATVSRWENDTPPAWVIFAVAALALTD